MPVLNHKHEWYADSFLQINEGVEVLVGTAQGGDDTSPDQYRSDKRTLVEILRCLDEDCSAARKREDDKMGAVYDYDA